MREFREYRNSMLWTPVVTAALLGLLMLASVILVNRINVFGDAILDAVMEEGTNGLNITVSVSEDGDDRSRTVEVVSEETVQEFIGADPQPAPAPGAPQAPVVFEVVGGEEAADENWNFSGEWRFDPDVGDDDDGSPQDFEGRELNPMLGVVHGILILILLVTSANYLLSSLYDDRKDRSILFWRSMPVSEWEIVASKFIVALILAPLIYIAISLVLQLAYVLLMMVLVARMDRDPFEVVVGNVDFVSLMLDPISGWLMTMLLIAPTYAWLMLASAGARRSPFMLAVLPVVGLAVVEALFLGTSWVDDAVTRHFPHVTDSSAVGFYLFGPDWTSLNLASVGSGLLFTAVALAGAVWLRRHRWELK